MSHVAFTAFHKEPANNYLVPELFPVVNIQLGEQHDGISAPLAPKDSPCHSWSYTICEIDHGWCHLLFQEGPAQVVRRNIHASAFYFGHDSDPGNACNPTLPWLNSIHYI